MSSVAHTQPSANGTPSTDGATLDRPDRLSLHAVWAQLERLVRGKNRVVTVTMTWLGHRRKMSIEPQFRPRRCEGY